MRAPARRPQPLRTADGPRACPRAHHGASRAAGAPHRPSAGRWLGSASHTAPKRIDDSPLSPSAHLGASPAPLVAREGPAGAYRHSPWWPWWSPSASVRRRATWCVSWLVSSDDYQDTPGAAGTRWTRGGAPEHARRVCARTRPLGVGGRGAWLGGGRSPRRTAAAGVPLIAQR